MQNSTQNQFDVPVFWRIRDVLSHVPFSRSTLLRLVDAGKFPKPIRLAPNVVAWRADAVLRFLETAGCEVAA